MEPEMMIHQTTISPVKRTQDFAFTAHDMITPTSVFECM